MILAIGDSNMYPACTESGQPVDPTNMVPVFSKNMDQPFKCWSKNGASNFWIRSHIDYFLAGTDWTDDTFLFVGWTSYEREEWPWLYSNISVCGGPDFGIPSPLKAKYEQWKKSLTQQYQQECINAWHDQIYQVHLELRRRGIRHLFWSTYDNFKSIYNQLDWHDNFFMPYDQNGCMSKFFEANNVNSINNDPFHYGDHAQKIWAETLNNYVREKML